MLSEIPRPDYLGGCLPNYIIHAFKFRWNTTIFQGQIFLVRVANGSLDNELTSVDARPISSKGRYSAEIK